MKRFGVVWCCGVAWCDVVGCDVDTALFLRCCSVIADTMPSSRTCWR